MRIAVLGGGAAGVTAARRLARGHAASVDLIEVAAELGGLHKSIVIDGLAYDVGAFVFNTTHELLRTFPELASAFVPVDLRYRRITPAGTIDLYPVSIEGYVRDNGILGAALALVDLCASRARYNPLDGVAAYACHHMGRRLYESTGLRHYVSRLYGLSDKDIAIDFALQRLRYIEQISLSSALKSLFMRVVAKGGEVETLSVLVRPPAGFRAFYAGIRELLESDGVAVHAPARLEGVSKLGDGSIELRTDLFSRRYETVISTVPIPALLSAIGVQPHATYEHMSLLTLFYKGTLKPEADLLYNFTFLGRWKRLTVFSRMYREKGDCDRFSVEITVPETSRIDIDVLRQDFERHAQTFHLGSNFDFLGSTVTQHAYPVFRPDQSQKVAKDRALIQSLGIGLAGRQGTFAYLSSLEAASQARALAERVVSESERSAQDP
jgi:uncharacterized protein with NAD-binding domain and iron-sulfur cluster